MSIVGLSGRGEPGEVVSCTAVKDRAAPPATATRKLAIKGNCMKKLALVFVVVLATIVLSFGLSWLFRLASRPSNLAVLAGLGGAVLMFFVYGEVLRRCVNGIRGEIKKTSQTANPTSNTKELPL